MRKISTGAPALSRRGFVSLGVATVTAGAAGALTQAMAQDADADLKALFAKWQAQNAKIDTMKNYTDEEIDHEMDVLGDIEFEMHACPARTWAGVAIKAAIARQYLFEFHSSSLDTAATKALFDAVDALAGRV